jgi:hypothetical protein
MARQGTFSARREQFKNIRNSGGILLFCRLKGIEPAAVPLKYTSHNDGWLRSGMQAASPVGYWGRRPRAASPFEERSHF